MQLTQVCENQDVLVRPHWSKRLMTGSELASKVWKDHVLFQWGLGVPIGALIWGRLEG